MARMSIRFNDGRDPKREAEESITAPRKPELFPLFLFSCDRLNSLKLKAHSELEAISW